MFAKYIKSYFENTPLDMNTVREKLMKHESGIRYLINPKTQYSKNDFFLALELDKLDFIVEAYIGEDKLIHLRRLDV